MLLIPLVSHKRTAPSALTNRQVLLTHPSAMFHQLKRAQSALFKNHTYMEIALSALPLVSMNKTYYFNLLSFLNLRLFEIPFGLLQNTSGQDFFFFLFLFLLFLQPSSIHPVCQAALTNDYLHLYFL